MSIRIKDLKESNEFLNILFENITSAVFIVDKAYKVHTVNSTFEILFEKQPPEIIGYLCGDVIGCGFAFEENKSCGATSHCKDCDLRFSSSRSVLKKQSVTRKILTRDFFIGNQKYKKHFQYSTRPIHFGGDDMAMIIVDDITENEEHKHLIQEKNREITQSIMYARGIQKTILPHPKTVKKILPESFVFYTPKDIISGDFYWVAQVGDRKYFAVADCTGHGVPGAIMSMLGITLLNEIVRNQVYNYASEILDKLRSEMIRYLKQQGVLGEHKDGMDIALCILETQGGHGSRKESTLLQFAGANIPAYLINSEHEKTNKQKLVTDRITIHELKPDKQPIGIYVDMQPFKNHTLQLHAGDSIYLATDGFADQFGGSETKKYKSSRLREFLQSISHLPMRDQQQDIEIEFLKWKGKNEQVDDVSVMGVRV